MESAGSEPLPGVWCEEAASQVEVVVGSESAGSEPLPGVRCEEAAPQVEVVAGSESAQEAQQVEVVAGPGSQESAEEAQQVEEVTGSSADASSHGSPPPAPTMNPKLYGPRPPSEVPWQYVGNQKPTTGAAKARRARKRWAVERGFADRTALNRSSRRCASHLSMYLVWCPSHQPFVPNRRPKVGAFRTDPCMLFGSGILFQAQRDSAAADGRSAGCRRRCSTWRWRRSRCTVGASLAGWQA